MSLGVSACPITVEIAWEHPIEQLVTSTWEGCIFFLLYQLWILQQSCLNLSAANWKSWTVCCQHLAIDSLWRRKRWKKVQSDTFGNGPFSLPNVPIFSSVIISIQETKLTTSSRNSLLFHLNNWLMIVNRSHNGLGKFTYQVKEHA